MPIVAAVAVPHPPLIVPQVGRGEEKTIQKTIDAYGAAMCLIAEAKPHTVVVFSPHSILYHDYIHLSPGPGAAGDFGRFGAPGVAFHAEYDTALVGAITARAEEQGVPAGTRGQREAALDHGTLVPLYFLNQYTTAYQLVRCGLSGLSAEQHFAFGQCVAAAAGEKRVAVIASGDLSHYLKEDGPYGFRPEGPRLDAAITAALERGGWEALLAIDPALAEAGGECGLRAFWMMAGALDGLDVQPALLSYEGPFGVGYAVATYTPQ